MTSVSLITTGAHKVLSRRRGITYAGSVPPPPWFQRPAFVAKTPMVVSLFMEYANAGQLWRMWHEHSALGQNLTSWLAVHVTLWLWLNFDLVIVPGGSKSWAFRATALGLVLNTAVILTVAYFRWIA